MPEKSRDPKGLLPHHRPVSEGRRPRTPPTVWASRSVSGQGGVLAAGTGHELADRGRVEKEPAEGLVGHGLGDAERDRRGLAEGRARVLG